MLANSRRGFPLLLLVATLSVLPFLAGLVGAQPSAGYYDTVDTTNGSTLRSTLHDVIDDHTRVPYTSTATDTWNVLELADEDPNNSNRVIDVYLNASYPKYGAGNSDYNREHSWPKSFGFPSDVVSNYPYSDCHHLFISNDSYNSTRNNNPYDDCSVSCSEYPTEVNDGRGGPGQSNWYGSGVWQTWDGRKGDVARAVLYMDVRYEGGSHGMTGHSEPDLILTDNMNLIQTTGSNTSGSAYMGRLSTLLQWHADDPVDSYEIWRNNVVEIYQGNRNPFIDNPEWVACIFSGNCDFSGDTTPPAAPTGVLATASSGLVDVSWSANGEGDLSGYNVYRSTSSGGPYSKLNGSLLVSEMYSDISVSNGTSYYYVVTAVDTSTNESGQSSEVSGTPTGGGSSTADPAWINEIHYDNDGGDTGEFVEIAGAAGQSLNNWKLVGYNGSTGATFGSVNLSGDIPDQSNCVGTLSFAFSGLQNGSPDGIALIDDGGVVVQFLSYEGSFTATSGDANGMTSTDIGVSEPSTSPIGWSLQLGGVGNKYVDFTWQSAQTDTPGSINAGQSFSDSCGGGGDTTPPADPAGLGATGNDGSVSLDWNDNGDGDLDGYNVLRSTTSGGPYAQINGALLSASSYVDSSVTNGTTYYYVVTAVDTSANESGVSGEASATPADSTAPAAPTGLAATGLDAQVDLIWNANGEGDLAGYNVYRSTSSGGPYSQINGSLLTVEFLLDSNVTNDTTYYYVVTAVDTASNESADSAESSATPAAPGGDTYNDATADFLTNNGTVSGSYADTAGQDYVYEALTEVESGGKPSNRYSLLDQVWTFNVVAGAQYTFNVDAYHSANSEGDDFVLEYSTDNSSYTPMVTITKTSDDDSYQSYVFSGEIAGTLYVRATDTDSTAGNRTLDTLYVDDMYILTSGEAAPDTTPPAAPTGLGATSGDGSVSLNWSDNGEGDLASYTVYRSTTSGSGYSSIATGVISSDYMDNSVTNDTTYYYVVTAVDTSSNESGNSSEANATPSAGGGQASTCHVSAIVAGTASAGKGKKFGTATVTVVDDLGAVVSGADVTVTFTGDFSETLNGSTDGSGVVVLTTSASIKNPVFTACVDDIVDATLTYASGDNVATCASF